MVTKTTLALCLSVTLVTAPLFGGTGGHLISLTEFSSTNLMATYDGSTMGVTVTPGVGDSWTVTLPSSAFILGFAGAAWAEPDNSLGNVVSATANSTLTITSDVAATSLLANKTTIFTNTFDTGDRAGIFITFNDVEDQATRVPDAGFSLGLFLISLTGLLWASRFRCFRLA